ncbi:hypothetical protein PPYR_06450 [Photinus pyralis]|uniref:Uncharacterized protein n=1 Tax=Photinus pyralis TaxID=7054 RepID=A0A5N4ATN9_PHOPY|nr:hypothetical protein PPYR_06450 [Photinus pyralis]
MALKVLVFAAVVAFAAAAIAPIVPIESPELNQPAHYSFNYAVQDETTGDFKSQRESRDGDAVHGRYTVQEPNGMERIVEYTADGVSGFNAVVSYVPSGAAHVAPLPVAKVAVPVAAADVPAKVAAQPVVKAKVTNPVHQLASPYGFAPFDYSGYPGYSGYHGHPGYPRYNGYSGYHHGSPFYSGYHPGFY